jgi:hypothetical protein
MLAEAETKNKVPFANPNGRPDKSDGSDMQVAKINKDLTLVRKEKLRSSRINYIKLRIIWQKNNLSVVPRARRKILRKMRLGVRESANKLSVPRHRDRDLHHQVYHERDSRWFRQVITVTQRRKKIIPSRTSEQPTSRQRLHAFNQSSNNSLFK